MALNYTNMAATAKRLITANGRSVTLRKLDRTAADASKPWRADKTATRASATDTLATAVFVEPVSIANLGFLAQDDDLLRRSSQIAMIAASETGAAEIETYNEVVDGTILWRIDDVRMLKPGGTRLLYIIGLSR